MLDKEKYSKVFLWLAIGLLVTFVTGYVVSLNETMLSNVVKTGSYIFIVIIEVIIAIYFTARISKMSKIEAIICYIIYSFTTGLTFASIFSVFKMTSIINIFLATAVAFLLFSFIGLTTKKDLSKLSSILFVGLLSIIIVSIINIFIGSSILELLVCIIGIAIFIGYIIYDIQRANYIMSINEEAGSIYAAFQIYLDFINLFIYLLRIFGKADD